MKIRLLKRQKAQRCLLLRQPAKRFPRIWPLPKNLLLMRQFLQPKRPLQSVPVSYTHLCDTDYPAKVIEAAVKAFGQVDILINCAGIVALDNAETISADEWNRTISINLSACFFMAQAVGKYMIDNHVNGSIVNMASQAGVIALDKHVAYCAAKGGIIAMTKVMAKEWGAHGIRVNSVAPTVVLTALGHKAWDGPVGDAFKKTIPAERFAEPEEIASVIAFLCSKGAGMITGHNLLVDGGFTIQ